MDGRRGRVGRVGIIEANMTTWTAEELESRTIPEPNTGCWLWLGATFTKGYGCVRERKPDFRRRGAHQAMYEAAHGPIPAGHVVMHRCDNPPCCNPAHLTTGTPLDNVLDMIAKGRGGRLLGADNAQAKLTEEDVRHIRRRREAGERLASIASAYGITDGAVSHIMTGRRWGHLR